MVMDAPLGTVHDTENLTLSAAMRAGYLLIALGRSTQLLRMRAEYTAVQSGGNEDV